jgi:histidine ammonia-lyase
MTILSGRLMVCEDPVMSIVDAALDDEPLVLSPQEAERMDRSHRSFTDRHQAGHRIYGVTHGFGPLVVHEAHSDAVAQGMGLIAHLGTSQGSPLPPQVCRMVLWLRLQGMKRGFSGVSPDLWETLAAAWQGGFIPLIQRDGTVSASGDLQPLAQAALALAGHGEAWAQLDDAGAGGEWHRIPAAMALDRIGLAPILWKAREALAFVNGTTVSLGLTMFNHCRLYRLARAAAHLTARMAVLLGANPEAYAAELSAARGQMGQARAAAWIRHDADERIVQNKSRPLQEPYSLRCAPQVIGAVLDVLRLHGTVLATEAEGCTDNPVIVGDKILHGGNFHAMPIGFCSEIYGLCVQQLAFLAERQLNMLVSPETNCDLPPMLTPTPGAMSGLAGVQISATSFVARIRQMVSPASLTALPTNLHNQDHVPMALNSANAVADALDLAWLVIGSQTLALVQWQYLADRDIAADSPMWTLLRTEIPPVYPDRPLAPDVRKAAAIVEAAAADLLRSEARIQSSTEAPLHSAA